MGNLALLLQNEATQNQYIFNFILMNIIFIISYINRSKKNNVKFTWFLLIIFCLFAYWDTDYFSFRDFYLSPDFVNFRDPLYYYLSLFSFNSYTIFRLIIWGGGLLFYIKSLKNFNIPLNISAFVFAIFYLLTFSFGRISLGVCMYFFGISLLLNTSYHKTSQFITGVILVICSYWGHRAMILPIALTPLILLKPNRLQISALIVVGFLIGKYTTPFLAGLLSGDITIGSGSAAEEALLSYASNENEVVMNWKFKLTSELRWYSIYALMVYCVWKCFYSKYRDVVRLGIKKIVVLSFGIFLIAFNLQQFDTIGANEMGERFLFILGIPLTLTLAFLKKENMCSHKTMMLLLLPAFVYAEGFIFGKILSF